MSSSYGTIQSTHQNKPPIAILVLALLTAIFAFQLNASMLSPVLATIEQELHATTAQVGMTQTAFFASASLLSLFMPRWGDLLGRKKLMQVILGCNFVGCLISALAPTIGILGLGRIIQGVSGPIVPMALIMLHVQIPDNRRYAKYMALLTAINGGIAGVDAIVGGWMAQHWGFRSVFWLMAGITLLASLAIKAGTIESRAEDNIPMDWTGVLFMVLMFGSLYFAFDHASQPFQANWFIVGALLLLALVTAVFFWRFEKKAAHPLVTTYYLRQRRTWATLLTTFLLMTGVFSIINGLIPNFVQDNEIGPGIAADTVSWWSLTPYAIAGLIMGPIAGQLASRFGYKRVLQAGLLLTIAGTAGTFFLIGSNTPFAILVISIFLGITFAGICNIMLNGLGVVLSPEDNRGYLPGMNSGAFNLGAGFSFALLFGIYSVFDKLENSMQAYHASIIFGAGILCLSFLVSILIPPPAPSHDT